MTDADKKISVSRTIEAPASRIFQILADPTRHRDFDGSGMLREAVGKSIISAVGDTFTIKMHRLGDDYLMMNHIVEFEANQRIFWEPAPGDISRAENHDPSKIGIAAGYRWGYVLTSRGETSTLVTEVFDRGPISDDHFGDGGAWINGHNPVIESMEASLKLLDRISRE